jgi:hypothetical protein
MTPPIPVSELNGVSLEAIIAAVEIIMQDLSLFAPAPIPLIAQIGEAAAEVIAAVVRAKDAGATNDALVTAVNQVTLAAADAQMHAELK